MRRLLNGLIKAVTVFDWPLLALLVLMSVIGLTVMHSAVGDPDWRFVDQSRNFLIAFLFMWVVALTPLPIIMRLAPYVYIIGVLLLLGVAFFGETSKGAQRWLDLGFIRLQPSEMLKIAVPMLLAWYFHRNQGRLRVLDFLFAAILLAIPFALIVKQPDLGTALLVFASGFCVIYFGGLSFRLLAPLAILVLAALGTLI